MIADAARRTPIRFNLCLINYLLIFIFIKPYNLPWLLTVMNHRQLMIVTELPPGVGADEPDDVPVDIPEVVPEEVLPEETPGPIVITGLLPPEDVVPLPTLMPLPVPPEEIIPL
jgi:hypothetical protein